MNEHRYGRGLDAGDWLLFLYLFKWADLCVAPPWLFILSWVAFVISIISQIEKV